MSLFGRQRRAFYGITGAADLVPLRSASQRTGTVTVTSDTALRHSAVWACLRLRADLISTMPVDVYRRVNGIQVEMPKPPVLSAPGGARVGLAEWLYSSQVDLDRAGNCFGLITETNAAGLPARIELQPIGEVSVVYRGGALTGYRISGQLYDPDLVWHERQFTVAGLPVGLSPVAYAAWSIGEYLSIQDFALSWYGGGAVPKARLKNAAKTIDSTEATKVKERYKASVANGDIFVHGADWEFDFIQSQQQDAAWIEGKQYGVTDIARFFGCPADMIDASVSNGSITYASITQRNLQLLIMNLQPAIYRREQRLSELLPAPRYVKFNTDSLLRMDPSARADAIKTRIESRTLTVTEARELENLPPLTEADIAEFKAVFGEPTSKQPTSKLA